MSLHLSKPKDPRRHSSSLFYRWCRSELILLIWFIMISPATFLPRLFLTATGYTLLPLLFFTIIRVLVSLDSFILSYVYCSSSSFIITSSSFVALSWSLSARIPCPFCVNKSVLNLFYTKQFTFCEVESLVFLYHTHLFVANAMVIGALICLSINSNRSS